MSGSKNLPALLTESEAAEFVGIRPRTWRRWTRSGLAPAPIKIGRGERPAIWFRRDELVAWLESGCKPVDQ
ncbi:MAG: helix-turn-helix domain-containing protein [Planctomycetia bacterium]|jgi:hypothetical protein